MHYPNGPLHEEEAFRAIPGDFFIMLDSEFKWRRDEEIRAYKPNARIVFRPLPDSLYNFNARRVVLDIVRNLRPDQFRDPNFEIVPFNESDLNYERGDDKNDLDFEVQRWVKRETARMFLEIVSILKEEYDYKGKIHFPAWAQGHWDQELVDEWSPAIDKADAIHIHPYGNVDTVSRIVDWYKRRFRGKEIIVSEWADPNGNIESEREVLRWLCEQGIPSAFFIWEWFYTNDRRFDVVGNPARLKLFQNPPLFTSGETELKLEPKNGGTLTESEAVQLTYDIAKEIGVDFVDALTGVKAEGLASSVRWNTKTIDAERAIQDNDVVKLRQIFDEIVSRGKQCDISFGLLQRSVCLSDDGNTWDTNVSLAEVMDTRRNHLNPTHSLRVGLRTYKKYRASSRDGIEAWFRYNYPSGNGAPKSAAIERNYREAYEWAKTKAANFRPLPTSNGTEGNNLDTLYSALFLAFDKSLAYNPDAGIVKFWKKRYRELGPALTNEVVIDGVPYQAFLGGIVKWENGASVV